MSTSRELHEIIRNKNAPKRHRVHVALMRQFFSTNAERFRFNKPQSSLTNTLFALICLTVHRKGRDAYKQQQVLVNYFVICHILF